MPAHPVKPAPAQTTCYFRRRCISCLLLSLLFMLSVTARAAETGWQALLDNRLQEAITLLGKEAESDAPAVREQALLGLIEAARLDGRETLALECAVRLVRENLNTPRAGAFLALLIRLADDFFRREDLREFISGLPLADCHLSARRELASVKLHFLRADATEEERMQVLAAYGSIPLYARLSGPFVRSGNNDPYQPFAPEITPSTAEFKPVQGVPVVSLTDFRNELSSQLVFMSVLPEIRRDSYYYAQVALKSEQAQEVLFFLYAPYSATIWHNGWAVYTPDLLRRYPERRAGEIVLRLNLRKGVNTLLFKCENSIPSPAILAPDGSIAQGIEYLPFARGDWLGAVCKRTRGYTFAPLASPPALQEVLAQAPQDADAFAKSTEDPAAAILMLYTLAQSKEFESLNELLRQLLLRYPQNSLLHSLQGRFALKQAADVSDSSERLRHQAEQSFRKALEAVPQNLYAAQELAGMMITNKQYQQAQELLRGFTGREEDSALYNLRLMELNLANKWNAPGLQALQRYERLNPGDLMFIADSYINDLGMREKGAEILRPGMNRAIMSAYYYFNRFRRIGMLKDAAEALDIVGRGRSITAASYLQGLRDLRKAEGDLPGALAAARDFAAMQPYLSDHAAVVAELALLSGDRETAAEFAEKAFRLSTLYSNRIDFSQLRILQELRPQEPHPLEEGFSLADLDPQEVKKEDHPRANHATLLRNRRLRIYEGLAAEISEHTAVKVFDKDGIDYLSEISLPRGGQLTLCRTIAPDGTVYIPESAENVDFGKAMSMYKVTPGSILEYAFSQTWSDSSLSETFYFQDFDSPVLRGSYSLTLPRKLLDRASISTDPEDFTPEFSEDGDLITLRWQASDQPGTAAEAYSQGDDLRSVSVTIHAPHDTPRTRFYRPYPTFTNPEIEAQALALAAGQETTRQKARAVFDWVMGNISEDTAYSVYTPRDTFALRQGGAFARAELARVMLAGLGVTSWHVDSCPGLTLVDTLSGQGDKKNLAANPSNGASLLRVALPEEDEPQDLWLYFDQRKDFFNIHSLGRYTPGAYAIEYSPYGRRLGQVMPSVKERHDLDEVEQVQILADGSARISSRITFHGDTATEIRQEMRQPHEAVQTVSDYASSFYPQLSDPEYIFPQAQSLGAESAASAFAHFGFKGTVERFAHYTGGRLSFTPFYCGQDSLAPVTLPRRGSIALEDDRIARRTGVYTAPEGWCFINVPRDEQVESSFGVYSVDFNVTGNQLTLSSYLIVPAQRIAPENAEIFNRFVNRLSQVMRQTVSLMQIPQELSMQTIVFDDPGAVRTQDALSYRPRDLPENLENTTNAEETD